MFGGWFVFQTDKDAFPNMIDFTQSNIFVIYVITLLSFVLLQKWWKFASSYWVLQGKVWKIEDFYFIGNTDAKISLL